jgi:hypothetical protein
MFGWFVEEELSIVRLAGCAGCKTRLSLAQARPRDMT